MSPVSVRVEVINNVTRRAYAAGAVWRSVGHLTTYGPIDSPTLAPPYLGTTILTILCEEKTRINQEPELLIAIAVPPRVIPTEIKITYIPL